MIGSPREWIEQPEGYTAAQFEGRLSSDGNGIEGQINAAGCRRFKVARGEISEQALEVTEPIDLRRLDSVGDLHTRCRVIYSWTLTLEREYPDLDLVGSLLRNIVPQAMNLFADEYMTELFGKPYDLLNQANRDSISRTFILPCFFRWSHKGIFTWQQKIIRTPFKRRIGGPFSALAPTVSKNRQARQWLHDTRARLGTLPATEESLSEIVRLESEGEGRLASLWPPANVHRSGRKSRDERLWSLRSRRRTG